MISVLLAGCTSSLALGALAVPAEQAEGALLVSRGGDLWIVEGGKQRQFTSGGTWTQPKWSPDGQRILYVYRSENFSEIFTMNRDGTEPARLTASQSPIVQDGDWALSPTWSPDQQKVAYVSDHASYNPMLWVMSADGGGKHQVVSQDYGLDAIESPSWSPDGETILFTGFKAGLSQIYRFAASTVQVTPVTLTSGGAFDPSWSPDGSRIAYVAREDGTTTVHVIQADGTNDVELSKAQVVRSPVWNAAGNTIAFLSGQTGQFELMLVNVDTSGPAAAASDERQVTTGLNADGASGLTWTP
jgi:Tol biopolymer transport system component